MDCYSCRHRRSIPGDAHSECHARGGVIQTLLSRGKFINVTLNPHGIKMGWALWPFNFDPIWVDSCSAYEKK